MRGDRGVQHLLVLGRGHFAAERRILAGCCQHLVHFPQALAEHTGEILQLAEGVVMLLLFGHGIGQFIA
ncbi:hypothetical protein D3C81_2255220 [compost metagenome]